MYTPATAGRTFQPAERWSGEYLRKSHGALFIYLDLANFKRSSRGRNITGDIVITLKHTGSDHTIQIHQTQQAAGQPQHIWKIPTGAYKILRVSLVDNVGRNRLWKGPSRQSFYVKPFDLSYFGLWTIEPKKNKWLDIEFKINKPTYSHQYQHQTFVDLIDGLSGRKIKELGGSKVIEESKDNFSTKDEARAPFATLRKISMLYKLNLGRYNRLSKKLVPTLSNQDVELRKCYADELEDDASLAGQIQFKFLISKDNGAMKKIAYSGGSLKNKRVIKCLYYKLGQMQFPVAKNIKGKITFQFKTN
jgi:hypothetical protein